MPGTSAPPARPSVPGDFQQGSGRWFSRPVMRTGGLRQISLHFFNSQPAETGLSPQISQQLEDFIAAGEPFLVSREEAAGQVNKSILEVRPFVFFNRKMVG